MRFGLDIMQNFLVAIDFSEITPVVIAQAESLAAATKSKLWLIHIAEPEPDFVGYQTGPQTERDYIAHKFRKEHRQLQKWAENSRQKGIDAAALLIQGPIVETILAQAQKLAVDLIVVGSHGHSGLYKALVGSISEGILQKADCPVMVIPGRLKTV
ncbi:MULTISPECIES: universal stress protein [Moorena]|uniref:Universal stress protein n=2 Tax=Moorena TaxID=1155738 RepID=F4XJZ4_9CYAN|nr:MULTISPECIES: universal stress protein [Moorena]EGJ34953.1 universal stress protein UspA family nucleotide-binding protein [Moorena producens 3L]